MSQTTGRNRFEVAIEIFNFKEIYLLRHLFHENK